MTLLQGFWNCWLKKIETDGKKDEGRNRVKLSGNLYKSAAKLIESKAFIEKAWVICRPYTQ
jgi:hypothetical protein